MPKKDRQHDPSRNSPASTGSKSLQPGETVKVPVVQEKVKVDKRTAESGQVVVHIEPHVKREVVDVPLVEQDVHVERVPVNQPVDQVSPPRQEGDVTIVPVYEEVVVVQKRLVLREEVRITRRQRQRHERQEVDVRTEEAHVLRSENHPR